MSTPGPRSPRILYVQERFPVLSETFVRNEVAQLRERGEWVSVATARLPVLSWGPSDAIDGAGRRTGRLAASHAWWLLRSPRRYLAFLRVLRDAPARDRPFVLLAPGIARQASDDAVSHVHTHFAFRAASVARAVASLLGCARSITTHANDIYARGGDLAARVHDAEVLTISRFNQRALSARGISSRVNHCGVDVDVLAGLGWSGRTAEDRPEHEVVFVGRFVAKKGPAVFVEAVRELSRLRGRQVRALMVGDGPLRVECEALAGAHGLAIDFVGAVEPTRTLELIAGSRVLCLPCQEAEDGDVDGIPVVLMEAMAIGTAVVSTSVSGIPELVTEDAGWLVSPEPTGLARRLAICVETALQDDDVREERAARARERIEEQFTIGAQADGVLLVTRELAST